MTRQRIDALLAERGLFPSREQARAAILAGDVRVDGVVVLKAGQSVDTDSVFEVAERPRFVSRGGDKLAGALASFGLRVAGRTAIDVGASTGGFTDCLLQEGASSVVALDVGYGQLAWSLRTDSRVHVIERTNIRSVDPSELGAPFDVVVCDVSFISLKTVMPHLVALMAENGDLATLIKPQFEAGKGRVGKRGVVRDPRVHAEAVASAVEAAHANGLVVRGLSFSPLTGPNGNIEFWMWASRCGDEADFDIEALVATAHEVLGG